MQMEKLKLLKFHWLKILLVVLLLLLLLMAYIRIFAIGSPYSPGETLDPACPPGEENCTVNIGGSTGGAFDGTQVITRGGLPGVGSAVGGVTVGEFLQNYFFPYVSTGPGASVTSATTGSREFGDNSTPSLSWSATKNTYNIKTVAFTATGGGSSGWATYSGTGNSDSGTATGTFTANTNTTWTITVTPCGGTNGTSNCSLTGSAVQSSTAINFYNKKYYGTSAVATGITDGQIIALANKPLSSSRATGTITSQISFGSSDYVYFAWPSSFEGASPICHSTNISGTPTPGTTTNCFNAGSNPVTSFILETRSFTNASGYSVSYNIYRSKNPVGGSYWVQ